MKKLVVSMVFLAFVITATAQQMAEQQAESIATYLDLNAGQKKTVFQLYKAEEEKQNQKRASNKPSDKAVLDHEKAEKSPNKSRSEIKPSGKARNEKPAMSSSDRFLLIAYRKAESNPSLKKELEKILTKPQYEKWQALDKK